MLHHRTRKLFFISGGVLIAFTSGFLFFNKTHNPTPPIIVGTITYNHTTPIYTEQEDGSTQNTINYQTQSTIVGRGLLLNQSGYILTNKHVVQNLDYTYTITFENKNYPIEKIRHHPTQDLAFLKISPSSELITNLDIFTNNSQDTTMLVSKLPIQKGDSGSPLINKQQKVSGIITAIDSLEHNTAYSIPVNQELIKKMLNSIILFGHIE